MKIPHALSRLLPLGCVVLASVAFCLLSRQWHAEALWFRHLDQDSMLLLGALDVNAGRVPQPNQHPGLTTYGLYAQLFHLTQALGTLPFASMDGLFAEADPAAHLPAIYEHGRVFSMALCIATALAFASAMAICTQRWALGAVAYVLFLFSGGLLFHALMVRTELTSAFCLGLAFLLIAARPRCSRARARYGIDFTVGCFCIAAALAKVQALPILGILGLYWIAQAGVLCPRGSARLKMPGLAYGLTHPGEVGMGSLMVIAGAAFGCFGLLYACHYFSSPHPFQLFFFNFRVFDTGVEDFLGTANSARAFAGYLLHHFWFSGWAVFGLFCLVAFRAFRLPLICWLLFGLVVGVCAVHSLRATSATPLYHHIRAHYLIFSSPLLIAACCLGLKGFLFSANALHRAWRWMLVGVFCLGYVGLRIGFVERSEELYNATFKNRPEFAMRGIYRNAGYHQRMLERYGSEEAFLWRIFTDPRLNGALYGLDIFASENCRIAFQRLQAGEFGGSEVHSARPDPSASPPRE